MSQKHRLRLESAISLAEKQELDCAAVKIEDLKEVLVDYYKVLDRMVKAESALRDRRDPMGPTIAELKYGIK